MYRSTIELTSWAIFSDLRTDMLRLYYVLWRYAFSNSLNSKSSQQMAFFWKLSVCSNAKPLHYYVLRVPRKADRWRWVWFFFESRTAWADQITCGMGICIVREKVEVRVTVCVGLTVCVVLLCCVEWWCKEGRRWNQVPAHSLLFSKSTKGAARFNVPIRRANRYQEYYMTSQHTYCRRVWNLVQDCDVQSSD